MHTSRQTPERLEGGMARPLVLVLSLGVLAGCADLPEPPLSSQVQAAAPAVPTGYRLAFDDEFDSTSGIGNGQGHRPPATPWWNARHALLQSGEVYVSATDRRAYNA